MLVIILCFGNICLLFLKVGTMHFLQMHFDLKTWYALQVRDGLAPLAKKPRYLLLHAFLPLPLEFDISSLPFQLVALALMNVRLYSQVPLLHMLDGKIALVMEPLFRLL